MMVSTLEPFSEFETLSDFSFLVLTDRVVSFGQFEIIFSSKSSTYCPTITFCRLLYPEKASSATSVTLYVLLLILTVPGIVAVLALELIFASVYVTVLLPVFSNSAFLLPDPVVLVSPVAKLEESSSSSSESLVVVEVVLVVLAVVEALEDVPMEAYVMLLFFA